jgi:helitron helicase-like protein
MWASADQTQLSYLQSNQGSPGQSRGDSITSRVAKGFRRSLQKRKRWLRATLYSGLEDLIRSDETSDTNGLGKRTILPSSYIGGPRDLHQRYQDAMALARFFCNVDLFITMTMNPEWDEIRQKLFPGQTSYDCPDLVARVFKLKSCATSLLDVVKHNVFGLV